MVNVACMGRMWSVESEGSGSSVEGALGAVVAARGVLVFRDLFCAKGMLHE